MNAVATSVEPVDRRRSLPPQAVIEHWLMSDGWPVRVARWQGTRGTIVFANGRGDFIEKYAEAIWDWRARDWGVIAFDWRGQGGSGRLGRTRLHGHARDFAPWIADLRAIIGRAAGAGPLVGVGHSMGGHLWLRALAEGENRVARVALISPMMDIPGGNSGRAAASLIAATANFGEAFAPGQRASYSPEQTKRRVVALTRDPERQTDEAWWLARSPELALGGCTWGWLSAVYRSIAELNGKGRLEAISTPILAALAGDERVTLAYAAMSSMQKLPVSEYEVFDRGRHELLREVDSTREMVMARIGAFLEDA